MITADSNHQADRPDDPVVSVIMPTHNQSAFLQEAIASLLDQTFQEWELLVVDDGSTDDTPNVLSALPGDTRIRVFRQSNRGQAIARNLGLRHARGEYVAFLDSDNRWLPCKLKLQVDYMASRPDVDVLYGGIQLIDRTGAVLGVQERHRPTGIIWRDLLIDNYVTFNTVILKRQLLSDFGGQDTSVRFGPDFDLWLRMARHCSFEYLPQVVCEYRVEGHRVSNNVLGRMDANRSAIRRFLVHNPDLLSRAERRHVWSGFYGKFSRAFSVKGEHLRALGFGLRAVALDPVSPAMWKNMLGVAWRSIRTG